MLLLETMILSAAMSTGIQPELLMSIVLVESRGRNVVTQIDGNSPSYGLGQVKIKTAQWLAKRHNKKFYPSMLMQPKHNLEFAALYLKYQLGRYGGKINCAIEAYNKGTARQCSGKYVNKVRKEMVSYGRQN